MTIEGMLSVLYTYTHPLNPLSELDWSRYQRALCLQYVTELVYNSPPYQELFKTFYEALVDYAACQARPEDVHNLFHEQAVYALYAAMPAHFTPTNCTVRGFHINERIILEFV